MRRLWVMAIVFATALSGGCGSGSKGPTAPGKGPAAPTPKPAASDPQALEELKGTWQVIAIEAAGQPVPAERIQKLGLQYVFDGNKVTIRRPDRPDNPSTFTVDASANPKKMTINQARPVRAVYAVDGKTLRLCVMVDEDPNAGYPTELASKPSPKTDLLTLERR